MKRLLPVAALAALMAVGCTGKKAAEETAAIEEINVETAAPTVLGQWAIENISLSDTLGIRPAETNPEATCTILFSPDSTFGASTGCNSLGGSYVLSGDSLKLDHFASTMMLCPDTRVEDALNTVLPNIGTIEFVGDSALVLKTAEPACFVELRRLAVEADEAAN